MEKPKKAKPKVNRKLTDTERHERFVQMAHEVGAATDEAAFEKAFRRVAAPASFPATLADDDH